MFCQPDFMTNKIFAFLNASILIGVKKKITATERTLKKKKLFGPFLWMGFNGLKARATSRRQFTFYQHGLIGSVRHNANL